MTMDEQTTPVTPVADGDTTATPIVDDATPATDAPATPAT